MRHSILKTAALLTTLSSFYLESSAQEFFPVSTTSRAGTTASALNCDGPHCLVYNPSQMPNKGITPSLDSGFVRVKQTYEHPAFDQVSIEITSPVASLGVTQAIPETPLTYGLVFIPQSYGEQKINGLPRRIAGEFESIYVRNKSTAYDLIAGIRYGIAPNFALGLALNRRYESRDIYAHRIGDDAVLFRYSGHNAFYIPTIGATWNIENYADLGLSYRFARKKAYKGRQKSAVSDDITAPKNRNYDPAVAMASAKVVAFKPVTATVNINRYFYESGKSYVCECLTNNISRADLKDIDERSLSLTYAVLENLSFTGSYGIIPSPWGPGAYSDVVEEQKIGADIGSSNNISRRAYALGVKGSWQAIDWSAAYLHSFGKREIGPRGDKPGFYQSEIRTISGSLSYTF